MAPWNDHWQPTASLANLELRSELLWRLRSFFRAQGFWEVQTPVLSRDTVIDLHIDPLAIAAEALSLGELQGAELYLQTSPEFGMKRLLAAGAQCIYQIGPVFRGGERGPLHNPEFTMVEWYRVGDDLDDAVDLLAELMRAAVPGSGPVRRTYQECFLDCVGVCPLDSATEQLAQAAERHRLSVTSLFSTQRDDWLDLLFAELVQPRLGHEQPLIVTHYPASQAALAKVDPADHRVAERFELFMAGVELANGYHELLAADELDQRNRRTQAQRTQAGKQPLQAGSRLEAAMRAGLPQCSGCALGLDRLAMVLCQAASIDQVLAFPIDRA